MPFREAAIVTLEKVCPPLSRKTVEGVMVTVGQRLKQERA